MAVVPVAASSAADVRSSPSAADVSLSRFFFVFRLYPSSSKSFSSYLDRLTPFGSSVTSAPCSVCFDFFFFFFFFFFLFCLFVCFFFFFFWCAIFQGGLKWFLYLISQLFLLIE
eukprot:GILK01000633.1.p1 GENE.GILK01000633.1~~GILK01000633.1.p1  ORF type:complete len:114 (+),score=32.77 GILK01000633.1:83-424(+)